MLGLTLGALTLGCASKTSPGTDLTQAQPQPDAATSATQTALSPTRGGSIAAGVLSACASDAAGQVWCWGHQTLYPSHQDVQRLVPTKVQGLSGVTSVVGGLDHVCALHQDGQVSCWGNNEFGQLGDGTLTPRQEPAPVVGLTQIVQVSAGSKRSCALERSGRVLCWGAKRPESGEGSRSEPLPTVVEGLGPATQIEVGSLNACAALRDATVWCWGRLGLLIQDAKDERGPLPVPGLSQVVQIKLGLMHACAMLKDGSARCWGLGVYGELGDGVDPMAMWAQASNADESEPESEPLRRVVGLEDVVEIAVSGSHSCARRRGGQVVCWGSNSRGQLGSKAPSTSRPIPVPGLHDVTQLSLGTSQTCAMRASGEFWCCGENSHGQLGDGTTTDRASPVRVKIP